MLAIWLKMLLVGMIGLVLGALIEHTAMSFLAQIFEILGAIFVGTAVGNIFVISIFGDM